MARAAVAVRRSEREDEGFQHPGAARGVPAGSRARVAAGARWESSGGCRAMNGEQPPPRQPGRLCPREEARPAAAILRPAPAAGWSNVDSPIPPFPTLGYGYPRLSDKGGGNQTPEPRTAAGSCTAPPPLSPTPFARRLQPGGGGGRGRGGDFQNKYHGVRDASDVPPPASLLLVKSGLSLPVYGRGRKIPAPTQNAPQPERNAGGRRQGAPFPRRAGLRGGGGGKGGRGGHRPPSPATGPLRPAGRAPACPWHPSYLPSSPAS